MNEESYQVYFEGLTDSKLNDSINELIQSRCDFKSAIFEELEVLACEEWNRRHPGTIAPCAYDRAIAKGGFPQCYSGPTKTVELEEE